MNDYDDLRSADERAADEFIARQPRYIRTCVECDNPSCDRRCLDRGMEANRMARHAAWYD